MEYPMHERLPRQFEQYRVQPHDFEPSEPGDLNGVFMLRLPHIVLRIISSGHDEEYRWEHVSVSTEFRCPIWEEMHLVKRMFWKPEEAVMQLHPPESEYVNCHPNCLHLWRPFEPLMIPIPPRILV